MSHSRYSAIETGFETGKALDAENICGGAHYSPRSRQPDGRQYRRPVWAVFPRTSLALRGLTTAANYPRGYRSAPDQGTETNLFPSAVLIPRALRVCHRYSPCAIRLANRCNQLLKIVLHAADAPAPNSRSHGKEGLRVSARGPPQRPAVH
jgi:hypothetical protein